MHNNCSAFRGKFGSRRSEVPVGARVVERRGEGLYGRPLSVPVEEGLYGRPFVLGWKDGEAESNRISSL